MEHEKEYTRLRELIAQLHLTEVGLWTARLDREESTQPPAEPQVHLRSKAWYGSTRQGFDAFHQYNLRIKDPATNRNPVRLQLVLRVSYESKIPIDEQLFIAFAETSLRLVTWPYLREYVHSTFARMNWPLIIAPTYRTGLLPASK
ncbi:MAG: hypothetical protein JXA58_03540 [Dehalococcoidia bacterium]|nr:hypothetical protein [Dehalococcoidia bacterium]